MFLINYKRILEGNKSESREPGYAVHHIQPLKGHYGIQGVQAGYPTLFPTGGLKPSIASHPLNLKKIPKSEHKFLHRRLYEQEKFWEINHSSIITGLKTELLVLNQCGCK